MLHEFSLMMPNYGKRDMCHLSEMHVSVISARLNRTTVGPKSSARPRWTGRAKAAPMPGEARRRAYARLRYSSFSRWLSASPCTLSLRYKLARDSPTSWAALFRFP